MVVIGDLEVVIRGTTTGLTRAIDQAKGKLGGLRNNLSKVGQFGSAMILPVTAAAVGLGVGVAATVKTFGDFEQAMAKAAAVSGATADELDKLKEAARETGKTTVFTAQESAEALFFLASAGFEVEEQISALSGVTNLAAAGAIDLGTAADFTASTIRAFSLDAAEATRIADSFASANATSNTTVAQLGEAMKFAAPVASTLGFTVEETVAALTSLADIGLKSTMAGTTLRQALISMINPSAEAEKVMTKLGISLETLREPAKLMNILKEATISESEAVDLLGVRGLGLLSALKAMNNTWDEQVDKVSQVGKAQEQASMQINTFQGSLKLLKSALQEVMISIGEEFAPIIREFVDLFKTSLPKIMEFLKPLKEAFFGLKAPLKDLFNIMMETLASPDVQTMLAEFRDTFSTSVIAVIKSGIGIVKEIVKMFNNLPAPVKQMIGKLLGFAAAVGAVIAVGAPVIAIIAKIVAVIGLLANPIGIVIAALAALFIAWETNFLGFRDIVTGAWDAIRPVLEALWKAFEFIGQVVLINLKSTWGTVFASLELTWKTFVGAVEFIWNNVLKPVFTAYMFILNTLKDVWDKTIGVIGMLWDSFAKSFEIAYNSTIGVVVDTFIGALNTLKRIWDNTIGPIWDSLTQAVGMVAGGVAQTFGGIPSAQTGGLITKSGLVNVHAGEVITPRSEVNNFREVNVTIQGTGMDPRQLYDEISRIADEDMNRRVIP